MKLKHFFQTSKIEKITAIIFLIVLFVMTYGLFFTGHNVKDEFLTDYRTTVKPGTPVVERITGAIASLERIVNNDAFQKDQFVELYGLTQKTLDKKVIDDAGYGKLYRTSFDQITYSVKKENVNRELRSMKELKQGLDEIGIPLLYIQAPFKLTEDLQQLPVNVKDYANDNADRFLEGLDKEGIDYLDLRKVFEDNGMTQNEIFFNTDHHWTIDSAFYSMKSIIGTLNADYGFRIDESYADISNYNRKVYKDFYIGSMGRRVGKVYGGVDDFTLITPNFDTDYTLYERDYGGEKVYRGTFQDAVLVNDYIKEDAPLDTNRYAVYHGDNAELEFINHKIKSGKVMMIKDSFGLPIYSFLSLGVHEVRALDVRLYTGSVLEYAREHRPDVVVILYNADCYSGEMFDFGL